MDYKKFLVHKTEEDLKEVAEKIAENITVRTVNKYWSDETTRRASEAEKAIVCNIAYAALLAIDDAAESETVSQKVQSIFETAKYTLEQFIPNCNAYSTIYRPLKRGFMDWARV